MPNLQAVKNQLKAALTEGLEAALEAIEKTISINSKRYDDLVHQQNRLSDLAKNIHLGTISGDDANLTKAQISQALLYLIDQLKETDLKEATGQVAPFTLSELDKLEQHGLKNQAELLLRKLNRIREALAIETDPSRQVQYETQIAQAEKEVATLKTKLT